MKVKRKKNLGFSLLELTIVMLISGLTLMALLQMLDLSFIHYKFIDEEFKENIIMSNARIWLRSKISENPLSPEGLPKISTNDLTQALNLEENFFIHEFKLSLHKNHGFFVRLSLCHDKNNNQIAEENECFSKLFYFRNRT